MTTTSRSTRVASTTVLLVVMLFCALPLISLLSAALQPQGTIPLGLSWPTEPHWENFADAWTAANITVLLRSSVLLVLGVVPMVLLCSTLAGYALGQLRVPFGGVLLAALLIGLSMPFEVLVTPLYYQLQGMGLLNTRWALILPLIGLNLPFATYWMRAHFVNVPQDIREASALDGAGTLRALWHIQLPLARSAVASLTLLTFLSTWNQFLLSIVLIDDPDKRTMAGALQTFVGQYGTDVVLLNAGALLIMAPTLLLFVFLQRHFIAAMLQGSVKG
ncbi:MAG TPA: carbohydrate ABC transporter permease [Cellulomonas sp.]